MALDEFFKYVRENTAKPSSIPQGEIARNLWNGFNNNPGNRATKDSIVNFATNAPIIGDALSGLVGASQIGKGLANDIQSLKQPTAQGMVHQMAAGTDDYVSGGAGLAAMIPGLSTGLIAGMMKNSGKIDDVLRTNTIKDKISAAGMEDNWWRGGQTPKDGKRTGDWYTRNKQEASGYAKPDLREYAIPASGFLEAEKGYSNKLAHDVADIISAPYYGKIGGNLAKHLRSFVGDEGITGGQIWQSLSAHFGNDDAIDVLSKLKSFHGIKNVTAPGEAIVFKTAPVRDAKLAKFDLSRMHIDDIYGKATVPVMAGSAGLGILSAALLHNNPQVFSDKKQSRP